MRVAIIGGGLTGLTAAYELLKAGHNVTLFEKDAHLGGLAGGYKEKNWDWSLEKAYHHLFTNDNRIIGLIKELGIEDKLIIKRPITANLWRGNLYPFDSPKNLLQFPGLSIIDKLQTAILAGFCKINPFWQPLEYITAKKLAIAVGGRHAWHVIWEPLLVGKFGNYADQVAASWLWARIKKRTPSLCYIAGGFETLVNRLAEVIKKNGGKIYTSTDVPQIKVKKSNNHCTFYIFHSTFDKILLTVPTPIAMKLISDVTTNNDQRITNHEIPHLHAQTLILETKEPILASQGDALQGKGVYWLNILDRNFPFLAAVAHTNFMDKTHYGGHHLTYFGNYLPQEHRYLKMTKEQLLKEFMPFIKRLCPTINYRRITNYFLFTGLYAQPVHELYYSARAPKLETRVKGIYLANMDSIYPWDRGTNYAVELGQKAVSCIQ